MELGKSYIYIYIMLCDIFSGLIEGRVQDLRPGWFGVGPRERVLRTGIEICGLGSGSGLGV